MVEVALAWAIENTLVEEKKTCPEIRVFSTDFKAERRQEAEQVNHTSSTLLRQKHK